MEKAIQNRGGSLKRLKASKDFLEAWKSAGYPKHFHTDMNGVRIWDKKAREEALYFKEHPEAYRLHKEQAELNYRQKLKRLQK